MSRIKVAVDGDTLMDATPAPGQLNDDLPGMDQLISKADVGKASWFLAILPTIAEVVQRSRNYSLRNAAGALVYPPPPDGATTFSATITRSKGDIDIQVTTDAKQGQH